MTDGTLPADDFGFPMLDPRDAPTLSLMGHDLRAALSEVMGGLRLVETTALDTANRLRIARTQAAAEALSLLLEQALSVMLGQRDIDDAPRGLLQTDRLLDSIRLRWGGRAHEMGLDFKLKATDLPSGLPMDGALLERVLANLLGNALKYAGAGCVTCRISATTDRLILVVCDEGTGFAENTVPRLFRANSRLENATKPGSGLGLQIVGDMVDRAGGSILARNRPEGGAEVTVTLPLPGQTASLGPAPRPADLGRCRVLVADDSATSRTILQQFLGQMGAEVAWACDGVQAIGRLERESFDLLLVDVEMPRLNGLDVIRHLRAMPGEVAQLPVLAITAHTSQAKQNELRVAGADAVLSKPVICPIALGTMIAAAMASRDGGTKSDRLRQHAPNTLPDLDPEQFDRLLMMAGPSTAAELVDRFLEDLQAAALHLTTARPALNWAVIRAQSHVLIALAGTAGANRLQRLAEQLNHLAHRDAPQSDDLIPLYEDTMQALQAMILFVTTRTRAIGAPP